MAWWYLVTSFIHRDRDEHIASAFPSPSSLQVPAIPYYLLTAQHRTPRCIHLSFTLPFSDPLLHQPTGCTSHFPLFSLSVEWLLERSSWSHHFRFRMGRGCGCSPRQEPLPARYLPAIRPCRPFVLLNRTLPWQWWTWLNPISPLQQYSHGKPYACGS